MPFSPTEVFDFFKTKLQSHGDSPAALDWSARSQRKRFNICLSTIELQTRDMVLDLGCGLGHLSDLVPPHTRYLGLDGCESMLAVARQRNNHTFQVADVLKDPFPEADLVVANGVLNLESGRNDEDMELLIERAFFATKKACVLTMLSAHAPNHKEDRHYYNPEFMLDIAFKYATKVDLLHSYLPHDFCLRMYR